MYMCVQHVYIPVSGVFLQLNKFFKIPLKITVYAWTYRSTETFISLKIVW